MPACVGSIVRRVWADGETWVFEVLGVFEEAGTDRPRYNIKMISVDATLFPLDKVMEMKSVSAISSVIDSYEDTILLKYDSIIEHLKKLQKC